MRWFGLSTSLIGRDHGSDGADGAKRLHRLLIGFETISKAGLSAIRKSFNDPKLYASLINDLHRLGISIQGCFVFGNDERHAGDALTRQWILFWKPEIDLPRFALLDAVPRHASVHARLRREGRILTTNWDLYDGQHVVFQPKQLSGGPAAGP